MKHLFLPLLLLISSLTTDAQSITQRIENVNAALQKAEQQKQVLQDQLESLKLEKIREDLQQVGLPAVGNDEQLIKHSAYFLSYAPPFKQARWVAHIITPDIISGVIFRTNDFRVDSLVKNGSAVEEDYFLKTLKPDGTYLYDGFGYDRGHLAPSADFRWSKKALSESYFYSNMSPQLADFNRGGWGDLEDAIRGYMYRNPTTQLYVVTGPFLEKDLPVIERGKNKVSIPKRYWKVAMDLQNKKAIGFIMPNAAITKPLPQFAVSIDSIEKETGLDLFSKVPTDQQAQMESVVETEVWFTAKNTTDVEPLAQENLPRNHFNTIVAKQWTKRNDEINVCGTVVGARLNRAGNVLINLDKQFPNQVFTVFVKKEDIVNFNYDLTVALKGKVICVKGKVIDQGGTPTMYIQNQDDLKVVQ